MIPYISELLSNAVHLQLPLMIYHIYNICDDIKPHLFINASHLISLTYANSLSCSTGPHRTQLPGNSGGFKISHDFFIFGKLRWIHDLTFYFPFSLSLFLSSSATQVASKSHIPFLPFFILGNSGGPTVSHLQRDKHHLACSPGSSTKEYHFLFLIGLCPSVLPLHKYIGLLS